MYHKVSEQALNNHCKSVMYSFHLIQLMEIQTQRRHLIPKALIGLLHLISPDSAGGFGPEQTHIFKCVLMLMWRRLSLQDVTVISLGGPLRSRAICRYMVIEKDRRDGG